MIPRAVITEWSQYAKWPTPEQVEQDLLLSRVLVAIYNDPMLSKELVFRGGTCLHKLYLPTARRYSEDLDFVRRSAGPIAPITQSLTALGEAIGFEVSTRISAQPKVYLRTLSATDMPLRIKLEMNTHERSPARPLAAVPHVVSSSWWSGEAEVMTFQPEELVATKIRAIFQRKKGRDLFDLWLALTELQLAPDAILAAYSIYAPEGLTANRSVRDLRDKIQDRTFRNDLAALVDPWPDGYSIETAAELVIETLLSRIPSGA